MEFEEFSLVLNKENHPIYDEEGTVLVQRNSDGYQFYVDPEAVIIGNQSSESAHGESVEFPVIPSSSPLTNNLSIEKHWSRSDILKLINEYKKNKDNFASSAVRNSKVWQLIAQALGSHDARQCENKFKYLKSKYLKRKDNMSIKQSGAQRIHFEYFDELDEIFRKQPIVTPAIASSSRENPIEIIETDETERESANVQEQQQPRSRNIRLKDSITNLNNILKESEENKEKRHKELLSLQKESLDTFKTLMEKMLEKM